MLDVISVAATLALFALVGLIAKGVERLVRPSSDPAQTLPVAGERR